MKNISAKEIEELFTIKQMQAYNCKIRSNYNDLQFRYNRLIKQQENIIKKEVEIRTTKYKEQLNEKDKIIEDKDAQIEALKRQISKMQSIMDNDSTNSGLPTSKTPIGKQKYIPNTREKTDKNKGGQKGHKKSKLVPFKKEEATEILEIIPTECKYCHSKNLERLETGIDKEELDYEVVLIKRINNFVNCKCKDCGKEFHADIPNDLKEEIQYGKTVQSLAICLTNDIYTPFNKTVKLIKGITNEEICMSEGYVTKLQKRASEYLEKFIKDLTEHITNSPVYGWDDAVVNVNTKNAILRTYCTDNVALFLGHEKKNEASLDEDGILANTPSTTIVMHDHLLHNYNDKYDFKNVECLIHLIRRLIKMHQRTHHNSHKKMIEYLSKVNKDRNKAIKEGKNKFEKEYLTAVEENYSKFLEQARKENEEPITKNVYKTEELSFINDLEKYRENYLLWVYHFEAPSTNNNSERNLRPVKSKMKISGQFQSIEYVKYYATIRSYIETCKKNGINIIEACVRLMNGNPYELDEILKIATEK